MMIHVFGVAEDDFDDDEDAVTACFGERIMFI